MSDIKHTPDTSGDKEPALSELISSAKENLKNQMAENAAETKPDDTPIKIEVEEKAASVAPIPEAPIPEAAAPKPGLPDISFKNSEESEKLKPKPNVGSEGADKPKRPPNGKRPNAGSGAKKPQKTANKPGTDKRPPAKKRPAPTGGKRPPAAAGKPKRQTPPGKRPAPKGKKPAAKTKKPAAAAASIETPIKNDAASGTAAATKFTKKQAGIIGGLIIALLLVLALIIYIIFSHYFNLIDSELESINNSAPMTYSDVDLSKPDTMNKAEEDEKLKELMKKGKKISNKDVMNLLLIGEDLRDTESGDAGNTDVMMIISVNTVDKTITLTSIMRDCYATFVDNNGYWYSNRINAAYWHGGVELTQRTIEDYMNVKIDRYVLVNFKTFIDIVDTLGGLDITVTDEEANGYPDADPNGENTRGMQNPLDEQNKYLGNKKGTDYIKKGGDLHLNGNQALAYARLRYVGNSDYERTERQRKVIKEMIKKSRSLNVVEMDELANIVLPQLKSDITKKEAMRLIVDLLDYRSYELQEIRVPADGTFTPQTINGMEVLSVDYNANAQIFRDTVYGSIKLDDEGNEANMTIE